MGRCVVKWNGFPLLNLTYPVQLGMSFPFSEARIVNFIPALLNLALAIFIINRCWLIAQVLATPIQGSASSVELGESTPQFPKPSNLDESAIAAEFGDKIAKFDLFGAENVQMVPQVPPPMSYDHFWCMS